MTGLLPRYEFRRSLGSGGEADVALVSDVLRGGELVVLKTLARADGSAFAAGSADRPVAGLREFRVLAGLRHPALAPVHDFGSSAVEGGGERSFFTRAFVDGTAVAVEPAGIPPAEAARLILGIADAIDPLHRSGLLHGDIKPGNVIVEPSGAVTLIDFSLARPSAGSPGAPSGTVAFMAPEMFRGEDVDLRADLYALGVLGYALLSGEPPFVGDVPEVIDGHLRRAPRPLGDRIRGADGGGRLARIVMRLLAKDPSERFPDVWEMRAALAGAFPGVPGASREPGSAALPALTEGIADVEGLAGRLIGDSGAPASALPVLVEGEPGSGKTTVLREAKWRAQIAGWTVIEIAAGASPGWRDVAATLVRSALLQTPDPPAASRDRRGALASLEEAAAAVSRADAADDPLLAQVHAAFRLWTAGRKVLVLVDDAHRLPPEILPLVRAIAAADGSDAAGGRLSASIRKYDDVSRSSQVPDGAPSAPSPEPASSSPNLRVEGLRTLVSASPAGRIPETLFGGEDHDTVRLEPLDAVRIGRLVERAIGQRDEHVSDQLHRWTAGSPALVYEALRALVDGGVPFLDQVADAPLAERFRRLWTDRLERLGPAASRAFLALAAAGAPVPEATLVRMTGDEAAWAGARKTLVGTGLARRTGQALALERSESRRAVLAAAPDGVAAAAADLLDVADRGARDPGAGGETPSAALDPAIELRLARCAGRPDRVRAVLGAGVDRLISSGGAHEAAEILEGVIEAGDGGAGGGGGGDYEVLGRLFDALELAGEPRRALDLADKVPVDLDRLPLDMLLRRARLAAMAGDAGRGDAALAAARARASSPAERIDVDATDARGRLRRGDHAGALAAAEAGLGAGAEGERRVDLLLAAGLATDYLGDAAGALGRFAEAAEIARACDLPHLESRIRAHEAFPYQHLGRLDEAAERYRNCLEEARTRDDRGAISNHAANLGAVLFMAGRIGEAMRHFETALAAARWVGRASTALISRLNLAMCLAVAGQFERATAHVETARSGARRLGLRRAELQADGVAADVARRRGDVRGARDAFAALGTAYREIGQEREAIEAALHRIECDVLLGDTPAELDPIARRVASSRYDDLRSRLHAVQARIALRNGDTAAAAAAATGSLAAAQRRGDLEAAAEAHGLLAEVARAKGDAAGARDSFAARRASLESIAHDLPERFRISFRVAHPDAAHAGGAGRETERTLPADAVRAGVEDAMQEPLFRLLDINRQMVRESDVERLFEAIMDAAIQFTGAERGFLLLPDEGGKMEIRRAREFSQVDMPEAHRKFSRSIADQTYRDGEPIVTVSAMDDERFGKILSVHELQLQSIICVPIRGRERTLGVLYLENRVRRGRFGDADRRLLQAFGDQVALALENASLIEALRRRSRELEEARASLERLCTDREVLLSERTEQLARTESDLATARRALDAPHGFPGLVGESSPMRRVFQLVRRVLDTDVPVVILGESGTGKEVVAKAIHDHGSRKRGRFVAMNCGAFPEGLIEAELFGHSRGAFTGAVREKKGVFVEASKGTLLLDEVGDMPAKMQADLLRTLQEGTIRPLGSERETKVDVRVLASTQSPLADLVKAGRFREDLLYRLNVVEIRIPPLRERLDDLPLLVDHFLNAFAARYGTKRKTVAKPAIHCLMSLPWPGNVRQLEHALLNAWVLSDSDTLRPEDFAAAPDGGPRAAAGGAAGDGSGGVMSRASFEATERNRMIEALRAARWNKTKAATALGMPRRTFYRKITKYGIDR